ncbi:MAG: hypothetical protein C0606_14120 [Hyphomicrobiales bacterium]|nr:MAG: hypothetical protein C0606_14120 [Hyphomicrobiales bacterium]
MQREDLVTKPNVRVASICLDPGEASPWHHHSMASEVVICLSGEIVVQVGADGERIALSPGERHDIALQERHRLIGSSKEPSSYLLVQDGSHDFVVEAD